LVESVAATSYSIQESAIYCLEALIGDEASRTMIIKQKNAVENIVKALDSPRDIVVMRACVIMDKLIAGNSKSFHSFTLLILLFSSIARDVLQGWHFS
jgi:6-phosphogluconate dehydrogenase